MSTPKLPTLPMPSYFTASNGRLFTNPEAVDKTGKALFFYTADQVEDFALQAIEADRVSRYLPAAPEGFEWVAVKGLAELCSALERAESKGYMPYAIESEWEAFDCRWDVSTQPQPVQAQPSDAMLDCDVVPRPLGYPLKDYHHCITDGPLHYTWQDKPHRIVYDLIAAVRFYAQPMAVQLTDEQIALLEQQLAEAQKDAERYRWLFKGNKVYSQFFSAYQPWDGSDGKAGFDASIDAAITLASIDQ